MLNLSSVRPIAAKISAGGRDSLVPVPRDTSALEPNCLDTSAPVWWCWNVLGPKSPGSKVFGHQKAYTFVATLYGVHVFMISFLSFNLKYIFLIHFYRS